MSNTPMYTNKNLTRKQTHQMKQDFEWKMTDIMEELNQSPEMFLETIHAYIQTTLVVMIKEFVQGK